MGRPPRDSYCFGRALPVRSPLPAATIKTATRDITPHFGRVPACLSSPGPLLRYLFAGEVFAHYIVIEGKCLKNRHFVQAPLYRRSPSEFPIANTLPSPILVIGPE